MYSATDEIEIMQKNGLYASTTYRIYVTFEDYFSNDSLITYYSELK